MRESLWWTIRFSKESNQSGWLIEAGKKDSSTNNLRQVTEYWLPNLTLESVRCARNFLIDEALNRANGDYEMKRSHEVRTSTIQFTMTEKEKNHLHRLAEEENKSVSSLVREIVLDDVLYQNLLTARTA